MFPNDLYITDPHNNQLWKIVNGTNQELVGLTDSDPRAVCVSQDKISVFVANKNSNTLSIFRNGERVSSNYVGNAPSAVCEDLDGNIYVCCYLSNSVIKLDKGGKQIATIMVDPGPYGICCDSTGTIWVSCFLSNKVDKIVNNQKVDSVAVANNPQGICCDPMDGVWVACYGSNVVDYIYKSNKILDIQVGKSPVAITSTSQGVIYVCNYNGKNVTKISKILNDGSTTQYHIETELIDVGLNPNSISVDQYDTVYVTNSGENSISVISDNAKISSIETVFSPTGYGDFTGCQLYNSINRNISSGGSGGGSGEVPEGGWTLNDLSKEIQQAINLVIGKEVETSAEFVKYNHSEYTNVKLALDFLIENYDSIGDSFQDDIDSINSIIEQIKTKNTQQDPSISNIESLYNELNTSLSTLTQKVTDVQNNMTIYQSNTNDRLDGIESDIDSIRNIIPPDVSDFSEDIKDLQDKFTGEQAKSALDSDKLGGKDPSYYVNTEQLNSVINGLVWKNPVSNINALKAITTPQEGWTVSVADTNKIYRFDQLASKTMDEEDQTYIVPNDGTPGAWMLLGTVVYNKATTEQDGLMSKEDKSIVDNLENTYLKLSGGNMTGDLNTTANILPQNNEEGYLGTSTKKWKEVNASVVNADLNGTATYSFNINPNTGYQATSSQLPTDENFAKLILNRNLSTNHGSSIQPFYVKDFDNSNQYGYGMAGIAFAKGDIHSFLECSYVNPIVYVGGGNNNRINWYKQLAFKEDILKTISSLATKANFETTNNYWSKDVSDLITQVAELDLNGEQEIDVQFPISFPQKCLFIDVEIINVEKDTSINCSFHTIERTVDGAKLLKVGNGSPKKIVVKAIGI